MAMPVRVILTQPINMARRTWAGVAHVPSPLTALAITFILPRILLTLPMTSRGCIALIWTNYGGDPKPRRTKQAHLPFGVWLE